MLVGDLSQEKHKNQFNTAHIHNAYRRKHIDWVKERDRMKWERERVWARMRMAMRYFLLFFFSVIFVCFINPQLCVMYVFASCWNVFCAKQPSAEAHVYLTSWLMGARDSSKGSTHNVYHHQEDDGKSVKMETFSLFHSLTHSIALPSHQAQNSSHHHHSSSVE